MTSSSGSGDRAPPYDNDDDVGLAVAEAVDKPEDGDLQAKIAHQGQQRQTLTYRFEPRAGRATF